MARASHHIDPWLVSLAGVASRSTRRTRARTARAACFHLGDLDDRGVGAARRASCHRPPTASFLALQSGVSRAPAGRRRRNLAGAARGRMRPMAASDERLVVAAKGELHALDAATGAVTWTERTGPLTAPPVVHGEWLFVASGEQRDVLSRSADGTKVWSRETRRRRAAAGRRGHAGVRARGRRPRRSRSSSPRVSRPGNSTSASIRPSRSSMAAASSSAPPESGSAASSWRAAEDEDDWCFQVGAAVIGRPAADATHVYFVALDNLLRAHDREERRVSVEEGSALPAVGGTAAGRRQRGRARKRAQPCPCSTRDGADAAIELDAPRGAGDGAPC